MVDIRQQELDFVEQQILTDIFGGFTPDKFVYRYGFFKLDLSQRIQKVISDFENIVLPLLDDEGYIDSKELKKFFINLPEGKYRPIEVYRQCQPFITSGIGYVKGLI